MWFSGLRARALVLGLAAASWSTAAGARDLVYRAPAGCPSQADVAARLEARAPEGRDARIDVSAAQGGFRGELVLGDGERRLARSIEARTCAAVVDALALVIALDRSEDVRGEEARSDDEGSAAPPPAPADGHEAPAAAASTPEAPPHASPAEGGSPLRALAGLGASGTSFGNGAVLLAAPVFLEVDSVAPWVFAIRSTFVRSFPTTTSEAGVRPEFRVTAGALDYCPVGAVRGGRASPAFLLTACARGELGVLEAAGAGDPQSERSRLWANAGGLVRTRVDTGGTGFRPFLELSGGLLVPLVRDRFHFVGNDPVTVAPVLATLSLGAGLVLW